LRVFLDEPVLFYGYRWLAWFFACISLAFPRVPESDLAGHAWLLTLSFMLNVMLTALANGYVRVVRRRPALLAGDVIASVALVWVGGGGALPFLPYALGALVLPALLLGWRGSLFACGLFALLDQGALWLTPGEPGSATQLSGAALRLLAPFLFVMLFAWLVRLVRQAADAAALAPGIGAAGQADRSSAAPLLNPPDSALSHFNPAPLPPRRSLEHAIMDTPVAAPLATMHAGDQDVQELRRVLHTLTPGISIELPIALDQLAGGFGRHSNLDIRSTMIGHAQALPAALHMALLRLAQEALLNVQQHAHAHSALLTLRYDARLCTLTIQDDGVGLLDGTHERPGVHALRALAYRLAEFDGSLEVFEGESGGVTVRGAVPLEDA
jgi:hypothetical protein